MNVRDHIIRAIAYHRTALEELKSAYALLSEGPSPVIKALAESFGKNSFSTSEAWRRAAELREEAESLGLALPDLPAALERAGIRNAYALGRFLGKCPEAESIGKERDGVIWTVGEIAKPQSEF